MYQCFGHGEALRETVSEGLA